jgi:hypothetical protein
VFFTRPGAAHDPSDDAYVPHDTFGGSIPLIRYCTHNELYTLYLKL